MEGHHEHLDAHCVLCYLALPVAVVGVIALIVIKLTSSKPDLKRSQNEKYYIDPKENNERKPFPSILDPPSVYMSIIVPSYNEEARLPVMLDETLQYLESRKKADRSMTYEVIVVDDGSRDRTSEVALEYSQRYGCDTIRVLTLERNRGKGGAVRLGMLSGRGKVLLFADADGASKIDDLIHLEKALHKDAPKEGDKAVSVGSRAHLREQAVAERTFLRNFLMHGFHFLVWFLCVRGIKDTQCGFKLLTRSAAAELFYSLHVDRWAFDVELLYLAQRLHIPISEVAINWTEIDGSTMVPFFSWMQMGRDLVLISLRYMVGGWKIEPIPK